MARRDGHNAPDRQGSRLVKYVAMFTVADVYDVQSVDTVEDQQAM